MRPLLGLCVFSVSLYAWITPEQKQLNIDTFEKVWTTVRDKHWEKNPGGLDWQAVHDELRPKIDRAETADQARAIIRDMLSRLKETHFAIFPAVVYNDVGEDIVGDGSTGINARVLDGQAVVVRIDPGSPAERAGVKPGWVIASAAGRELAPAIRQIQADPAIRELNLERAVLARITGPVGAKLRLGLLDGANRNTTLDLTLDPPRGEVSQFGNLPATRVWFESKKIGNTAYVGFNMFLDLPRVMARFGDAVSGCMKCDGLIIDLRGNPGGIGGMAMGMAGWLIGTADQRLGTMYLRDATINFVINPRPEVFAGPVAILVDGSSASTSEIFAGGLKDLGRARIFGTRTAAAALPSVIERLPNGDGFQYAMANYISEGGKALEGVGVSPDVEVKLTREALLAGHDPVVDAALDWIRKAKRPQ
jgi:carboxyl-terminal processing protease